MSTATTEPAAAAAKSPLQEITQPFIDLVHAPRALWGVNVGYFIEGFVYFGILTYLAMYFNEYVGLNDVAAGRMVGVLTAGITISMFLFGGLADRWGVRIAMLAAFVLMLVGRVVLAAAPQLGAGGWGSALHLAAMGGIVLIVLGYGMYQPAAYAAVRQFTTPATAGMGYAMLYALMNLGGWLPTFMAPVRNAAGIAAAFWVYAGFTAVALLATAMILSRSTVEAAILDAKMKSAKRAKLDPEGRVADDLRCVSCGYNVRTLGADGLCPECAAPVRDSLYSRTCVRCANSQRPSDGDKCARCGAALPPPPELERVDLSALKPGSAPVRESFSVMRWLANHPLANPRFAFFIFALIPVQTLFAHNWLTLPMYVERAYRGTWLGNNFEVATNFNPILIFILVPIVTALTQKRNVYTMMILGTLVMAAPTFFLALGPSALTLAGYLIIMTVGEAMWQPRFLQYAAEIAPEGRTGAYMGVAQFPWFLTKLIVPLYSGWFLMKYCPATGPTQTQTMWLIYGCIAMVSPILLIVARPWIGRHIKGPSN
jgi:MFS family permease